METIIKEGKDLQELLNSICEEYSITNDDFYYNYKEKKNGLFNKNISYEVNAILKKDLLVYIKDFLQELLSNMGLKVTFETKLRENVIYIKMYTDNNPILIGKSGNTLKSLETIVRQKVSTDYDIKILVNLDVENYREKQEKRLVRFARDIAKDVVKTKVPVELDNMNAYDRRIIHNALSNFKGISSESVGEEPNRHIVIKPE